MIASWVLGLLVSFGLPLFGQASLDEGGEVPKVAIFPWTFSENESGTSEAGMETATRLLTRLFQDKAGMAVIPEPDCRKAWGTVAEEPWTTVVEDPGQMPPLPAPSALLRFGRKVGADYVCAGRLRWHVRSIWVGLGPKTKVNAFVDVRIVDVRKQEVVLDVKEFRSDSSRAEKWYESAGALLVHWGITVFSGGPKTPHIQKAAVLGIGGATEPFLAMLAQQNRKIKLQEDEE